MRRAFVSHKHHSFGNAVISRAIGGAGVERVSVVETAADCVALHDLDAHCCFNAETLDDGRLVACCKSLGLAGLCVDYCVQDVVVEEGYVVVYIVRVLPARYTDVVCWMDAQGVQHLTCVRGVPSNHPAATRQPKQSTSVLLYEGSTSGGE